MAALSLALLRKFQFDTSTVINQWYLIHVVLNALKHTKPSTQQSLFDTCNLNPKIRVSFPEWYKKIESFLQKEETFKVETSDDKYLLLLGYWHRTLLNDKKRIISLIEKSGRFIPDCIQKLNRS